jgi:hypothetical protein
MTHPFVSVVVIAILAVLARASGPTSIAQWARLKSHPTVNAADRALQVDAAAAAVEVADPSRGLVVEGAVAGAAHAAARFFGGVGG